MTTHRALDEERRRQHKANTVRLNIIIGILGLIATYILLVWTLSRPFKTLLDPSHVFHSQSEPQLAQIHQYIAVE